MNFVLLPFGGALPVMTISTATHPGNASARLRSVARPRRTVKYACGSLGHAFSHLLYLCAFRDELVITGKARRSRTGGMGAEPPSKFSSQGLNR